MLADAACIALNALKPHYVRHDVDTSFYMSDLDRTLLEQKVSAAVKSACQYVESSEAAKQREK